MIDLGTGDGRAVLAEAGSDPDAFVLGIDADARAMAEASRRAATPAARPSVPNVLFIATGVDQLPCELDGIADRVTVRFPWGSLLRGALGRDAAVAASIARLVAPGGRLDTTLSIVERDRPAGDGGALGPADLERMTTSFAALGLELVEVRRLTADDVAAIRSTWAQRLAAGRSDRPVWRASFARRREEPLG